MLQNIFVVSGRHKRWISIKSILVPHFNTTNGKRIKWVGFLLEQMHFAQHQMSVHTYPGVQWPNIFLLLLRESCRNDLTLLSFVSSFAVSFKIFTLATEHRSLCHRVKTPPPTHTQTSSPLISIYEASLHTEAHLHTAECQLELHRARLVHQPLVWRVVEMRRTACDLYNWGSFDDGAKSLE